MWHTLDNTNILLVTMSMQEPLKFISWYDKQTNFIVLFSSQQKKHTLTHTHTHTHTHTYTQRRDASMGIVY